MLLQTIRRNVNALRRLIAHTCGKRTVWKESPCELQVIGEREKKTLTEYCVVILKPEYVHTLETE